MDSLTAADAHATISIVAHSGGDPIAQGVADARPDALTRIVHVDTVPLPPGIPLNAELPTVNGEIPLPDWSFFDEEDLADLTEELRERFRARAVARVDVGRCAVCCRAHPNRQPRAY